MAAEVDFGDLKLFEAFDHPEESLPKPVHTRFKDDDGDEEDENGVGDAELRERLRQCEDTIEQLRAENILPARAALSVPRACGGCRAREGAGGNSTRARIRRDSSRPTGGLRIWGVGLRKLPSGPRRDPLRFWDPHPGRGSLLPPSGPGRVWRVLSGCVCCQCVDW